MCIHTPMIHHVTDKGCHITFFDLCKMVFPKKRQPQEIFQPQIYIHLSKVTCTLAKSIQIHHCHQFVLFQPRTLKGGGTAHITQVFEHLNLKFIGEVHNKVIQQKNGEFE